MRTLEQAFPTFSLRFAALVLVALAAWLQSLHVLSVFGVNPDSALSALIAYAAFEKNPWYLGFLALVAFFILFPVPMPLHEFIAFVLAVFSGLGLLLVLPERFMIGSFLASLAAASLILYLVLDPGFLAYAPQVAVSELLLNCILGTLAAAYLKFAYAPLQYR